MTEEPDYEVTVEQGHCQFEKYGSTVQMWPWPKDEQKSFSQRFIEALRENGGALNEYYDTEKNIGNKYGNEIPLPMLHHIGARSGALWGIPSSYSGDGRNPVVVSSDNGANRTPDWVHNIRANPKVRAKIGRQVYPAVAEELVGTERENILAELIRVLPFQVGNQKKTRRNLPIVRLRVSKSPLSDTGA
ncbi:nitroreductase/quinone reductase family protein [Mycobacteroides abscessus]|uniref:nitroreductase/quinone reductase family protein n=1 Tax=Mycobacteroides abscessus TaxID=36809 RepID=UPI000C2588A2|nr:nitroreductase/quinone reductase family protein [Mycobacteroides abscessus]